MSSLRANIKKRSALCSLGIGTLILTSVNALAQQAELKPVTLPEIVVTGERQNRTVLETKSSVTVYDEERLLRETGRDINDVVKAAPNLQLRGLSELPVVRGIEGGAAGGLVNTVLSGAQSRLPIIVDDVALPPTLSNSDFTDLWDVEQLEVLRGTQTTYRGRSAIAGAIVVQTKKPTYEIEAAARQVMEIDAFDGVSTITNIMASGPVIDDRLALRFTVQAEQGEDPRDVVNVTAGGDEEAQLEFKDINIRGQALLTPKGEEGPLDILASFAVRDGVTPQTRDTVQLTGFSDGRVRSPEDREIDFGTGGLRSFDNRAWVGSLRTSYNPGGGFGAIKSVTSLANTKMESREEQADNIFIDTEETGFNQDFIYEFGEEGDALGGIVGVSFAYRDQDASASLGASSYSANSKTHTYSLFGDFEYALSEKWTLLLGGRLIHNREDREGVNTLFVPSSVRYNESETEILPSLGARYRLSPEQNVSLVVKKGWNPGSAGINFLTGEFEYDSETVWTVEPSYRFQSADRRLNVTATAFFSHHKDPQFYFDTTPGVPTSVTVKNMKEGISYGAELELSWHATDDVRIDAGLGLLETEITKAADGEPEFKGNDFGKDPRITANLGAIWYMPWVDGLSLDGRVSYVGESATDLYNFDSQNIGDYALVDIGLTYEFSNFEGRLFVNNLTDAAGKTFYLGRATGNFVGVTPARTFGASLAVRF